MDLTARPFPARASAVAARGMVATSQPLATRAGLRALERGGNAVDAALAAAAVLCVVEPMSTGIGGDCFALVWRDGELTGLNASGQAPVAADPDAMGVEIPLRGPLSITAPGAVAGWAALAERHGRLGLDAALGDAIEIAESGFAVTPVIARSWAAHRPRSSSSTRRVACFSRRPEQVSSSGFPSLRRRCAGSRATGPTASIAARWRTRSARSRRWCRTTSTCLTRNGSSRCASTTAGWTCARFRPTARAWRRCRRWASSRGSTTRAAARSIACTSRPRP